jgi:toxin-antitoxin system PIN domain toxin
MTLYFPDVNVWLALVDESHVHHVAAATWLESLTGASRIIFARYTQLGFLRLLTTASVMGDSTFTLGKAFGLYERWLEDPRVEFHSESAAVDEAFRQAATVHFNKPASKTVGDCYLVAFAKESNAALVTFDKALLTLARKSHCAAVIPS